MQRRKAVTSPLIDGAGPAARRVAVPEGDVVVTKIGGDVWLGVVVLPGDSDRLFGRVLRRVAIADIGEAVGSAGALAVGNFATSATAVGGG